jgi:hypothetical protein
MLLFITHYFSNVDDDSLSQLFIWEGAVMMGWKGIRAAAVAVVRCRSFFKSFLPFVQQDRHKSARTVKPQNTWLMRVKDNYRPFVKQPNIRMDKPNHSLVILLLS